MEWFFQKAAPEHVTREKQKAKELRQSQWWRQQLGFGRCYFCQIHFSSDALTMEHLVPIIRGGKTTKKNVVVACKGCNSAKGYLTADEFRLKTAAD